ncbi:GIN domain-containing protein [Bradyrhizobium sp. HKCCYLR20261]|uniref:GIN domain-containing protein n=1 Tax=Bradyrhizobium sp. HKCCYLR20261 TaxID=3420760 RepID=UPI003EB7E2DF
MGGRLGRIAAVSLSIAVVCGTITALASAQDWVDGGDLPWTRINWSGRSWAGTPRHCAGMPSSTTADSRERRTVDLGWSGSSAVVIRIPAQVHFKPGPSPQASVAGDPGIVEHVRLNNGQLEWDPVAWGNTLDCLRADDLVVQLSGPAVSSWTVSGSASLDLADLQQDAVQIAARGSGIVTASGRVREASVEAAGSGEVDLGRLAIGTTTADLHGSGHLKLADSRQDSLRPTLRGSGTVTASGTAQTISLEAAGSGRADLGRLVADRANVTVRGSGDVDLAPRQDADISVSGSAVVRLHGAVARLNSHVSGSARVKQVP